jgi:quercetin dioxygenase-like cupin family protein
MRLQTWITALLFGLALVCRGTSPAAAQDLDSVKADAAHHKVEFENDQVRVVRYRIAPGDKTANHGHPNNVNIPLTDVNAKFTTPDGKTTEVHGKAGAVAWRGATTHVVENTGDKPIEGILVEPKKPSSAFPAGAVDETIADPKHAKVEFENDQVRVVRYHYEPGEKSAAMHGHPDNVQVFLTDSKANVTTPDGKTAPTSGKAGEARWRQATQHSVQNTGDKAFEGILVEMKGAPGAKTTGE